MNNQLFPKSLVAPVLVSILLVGMFLSFLKNFDNRDKSVIEDIKNRGAIVLEPDCSEKVLSDIIFTNGYAETEKDADFIASVLKERLNEQGPLPSLYTLQKRAFGQVSIQIVDSCGVLLRQQEASYKRLGQRIDGESFVISPYIKDSDSAGDGKITVRVYRKVESPIWWKKILRLEKEVPCAGIPVRLLTHFRDSLNRADTAVVGYLITDSTGRASFDGLDKKSSYSVLPINIGFEYGSSKGTINGKWPTGKANEDLVFSFEEKEHRIPLFGNAMLRQIKTERTILVRSPKEYKSIVVRWFILVLLAWWFLCIYMIIRRKKFNGALLASCMFLTGLCALMMFSMQDPLNDELHGVGMGQGILIGLISCIFFQEVDFIRFYQNKCKFGFDVPLNIFRWFFKPYRQKVHGVATSLKSEAGIFIKMLDVVLVLLSLPFLLLDLFQITRLSKPIDRLCERLPKGIGWLILALIVTALLWVPGIGQSIGGMRVNLRLFGLVFQPSEIAKYLILLFMAAFFTQKADIIIAYSKPNRIKMLGSKVATLFWIIVGLAALMAMYIALGDMGPGLVIGVTFILLYSIIKSKVNLENLEEEDRWRRIFSCDFAMLVYGVLSFAVFLIMGYKLGNMLLFGVLWFVFWIVLGYLGFKKQLFESPLMLNAIVFLFIFGGQILGAVPALKDSSTVERFEARTMMCANTWGDLDIEHHGKNAEPVSNTQVANGLWALASGGVKGQGWGGGKPSLIPAFHTDMILSSIGEQLGWIGLLLVVIALTVLLRRMAVTGYRVGHPFAFYLCLGFAIVIGVQFFIIALGSSGMIPLTGVTVPFLSFGRVSMILNLAAFGVVLSLCNRIQEEGTSETQSIRKNSVEQYSYPIAMVTAVFLFFAVSTLLIWQYYQLWRRNSTLIHPAYVINAQGSPVVEYNPRINLLMRNMYAGRIYDRNGILLATSDKSEISPETYTGLGIEQSKLDNILKRNLNRYYPMGEHMFFMVGDQNEGIMFAYNENHPVGYMAEVQHLSYLRGFDNVLYDKAGKAVQVKLKTNRLQESAYLVPKDTVSEDITLRDYSELVNYLKDGIDGKKVAKHNKQVKKEKYDLHLTVDAALQVDLQNSLAKYMHETKEISNNSHFNLMRSSIVVLDAENGDLLASANYPIPDYKRLRDEEDLARETGKRFATYSDNEKGKDWNAYSDRDLGTTFQSAPGSTAKIMSAIAGFEKISAKASAIKYHITAANAIEKNKKGEVIEPIDDNRGNPVSMERAIVESSNCYFVNFVNDNDLYSELENVYTTVGVSIGGITPYYYTQIDSFRWKDSFHAKITDNRSVAITKYELFKQGKLLNPKKDSDGERRVKPMMQTNMSVPEWKWAWGQGYSNTINDKSESYDILASPLNLARIASSVVNQGRMPITQYLIGANKYEASLRNNETIQLLKPNESQILKKYMLAEAANQYTRQKGSVTLPSYVGGKTGTPERARIVSKIYRTNKKTGKQTVKYILDDDGKTNDGWYMFFVEGDEAHHPIAVAVRIERGVGSGSAVRMTGNMLLDCLNRHGYIRNK